MHELQILIPDNLYDKIKQVCKKKRIRESDLILLALNKIIEEMGV